jgi:hypothetical protein
LSLSLSFGSDSSDQNFLGCSVSILEVHFLVSS